MQLFYGHLKHPVAKAMSWETVTYIEQDPISRMPVYGNMAIKHKLESRTEYFVCPLDMFRDNLDGDIIKNKNSKKRISFDFSKDDVEKAIQILTNEPVSKYRHSFTLILEDGTVLTV